MTSIHVWSRLPPTPRLLFLSVMWPICGPPGCFVYSVRFFLHTRENLLIFCPALALRIICFYSLVILFPWTLIHLGNTTIVYRCRHNGHSGPWFQFQEPTLLPWSQQLCFRHLQPPWPPRVFHSMDRIARLCWFFLPALQWKPLPAREPVLLPSWQSWSPRLRLKWSFPVFFTMWYMFAVGGSLWTCLLPQGQK